MSRSALLVIDVQDSFLQRPYWDAAALPAFRDKLLALIAGARARGLPVVYVLHEEGDGPFGAASGLVRPMAWLPDGADVTFTKHVHNAFTDTGLQAWLAARGIDRLIVSGIRSEQCCETTTRVGSDLGFAVDYVSEATLTFAMTHPVSGRVYSPEDIIARTELVLAGRFAEIHSVDSVLARLDAEEVCHA
jgi:nicotinamidase-related amidase